jgi:hypothetical protein
MRKADWQGDKTLVRDNASDVRRDGRGAGQFPDADLRGDLPRRSRADKDGVAFVANRVAGGQRKRRVAGKPPEKGMGVEQQIQDLLLPRRQFVVG